MAQAPGITIADAAELLGLTPQGVRDAHFTEIPGQRPKRVSYAEVQADFYQRLEMQERSVRALVDAGRRFSLSIPTNPAPGPGQDLGNHLMQALAENAQQREIIERLHQDVLAARDRESEMRVGLASADTRILGLQADLREANIMVESLTEGIRRSRSDPDFDFDRPVDDKA